jgi:hypothetical protein
MKFNPQDYVSAVLNAKKAGLIQDAPPPPRKQNAGPTYTPQAYTCHSCQILFVRHNHMSKHCNSCKEAPKACEHCNNLFTQAYNKKAKTCGPNCARELMRAKKLKRN